jgi:hypothetical protein
MRRTHYEEDPETFTKAQNITRYTGRATLSTSRCKVALAACIG